MTWKTYPWTAPWGDPEWFRFPDCDGDARRLGVQTYFVDGFLRGATTGTQYAFLTVFTDARIFGRTQRFSFFSLALFDCDRRRYGTCTDFDFPHPEAAGTDKLATAPDHLSLRYEGAAGVSEWRNRRAADGSLRPFAWTLLLRGVDHHGARMELELEADARRPPAPLGGPELGGEMMFLGAERTFSYFQSGLEMRGRITWGEVSEEVSGTIGWIDRQWAEDDFAKHQDPESSRYRNEWRVIQLDNGWDLSCFHQYQRDQRNAVVPWTGVSAQGPGPGFEIRGTHRVELTVPEFIRSPGVVRGLLMLSEGPRWFPARYRLRVPEWDMDLAAESLCDAPAHGFPIEWWSGPVRIEGRLFGERVQGLGFDERSCPRIRGFEIAEALKIAAEHAAAVGAAERSRLSYRAWEVEALALRGDPGAAAAHLERRVLPLLAAMREPPARLGELAGDLLAVLRDEERANAVADAPPQWSGPRGPA
jgi:predicted secreted hydrolase